MVIDDTLRRKQAELADFLADFDGCEGGEMLRGIADLARRSQDGHGYAMSDKTEGFLRHALRAEIDAQIDTIESGEAEEWREPNEIAEASKTLQHIHEKYA